MTNISSSATEKISIIKVAFVKAFRDHVGMNYYLQLVNVESKNILLDRGVYLVLKIKLLIHHLPVTDRRKNIF